MFLILAVDDGIRWFSHYRSTCFWWNHDVEIKSITKHGSDAKMCNYELLPVHCRHLRNTLYQTGTILDSSKSSRKHVGHHSGTTPEHHFRSVAVMVESGRNRLCQFRQSETDRLVVPPLKLSTIGSRTFNVAAARTWNGLPEDVTSSPTLPAFRKDWKRICFANLILTLFLNYSHFV